MPTRRISYMANLERPLSLAVVLILVIGSLARLHSQQIQGTVTIGLGQPVADAVVRIEAPGGKREQARTDANGRFATPTLNQDRVLVSVIQNDELVYRAIRQVGGGPALDIRLAAAYDAPRGFDPIALVALPGGSVYAADNGANGRLIRFDSIGSGVVIGTNHKFNGITGKLVGGVPAVYGCIDNSSIVSFDRSGSALKTWPAPATWAHRPNCMSVTADPDTGAVYLAHADNPEASMASIYLLDENKDSMSRFAVVQVRGVGPMAVFGAEKTLFLSDVRAGAILSVDLARKRATTTLVQGLGPVNALAADELRRRLYVAEGNRVRQIDLAARPARLSPFTTRNIGSASALGVDAAGLVYVGDRGAHALLVFSPDGDLVATATAK